MNVRYLFVSMIDESSYVIGYVAIYLFHEIRSLLTTVFNQAYHTKYLHLCVGLANVAMATGVYDASQYSSFVIYLQAE